jgi:hypothetical protein
MATRRALLSVMLLATVSLTACATGAGDVAVAQRSHPAWLAGTWTGSVWQTSAAQTQGSQNIAVTFANDGAWKSTAGGSGTSWWAGDRLVVDGVTGDGTPIKYTFKHREKGGEQELWGVVQARFGTGAVSVTRMP